MAMQVVRCGTAFLLCAVALPCLATRIQNVNPSMNTDALQRAIKSAERGASIRFAPGTYRISKSLAIPCRNLQITGPETLPQAAVLAAESVGYTILSYPKNCDHLGTLRYLHFANTGAVYIGADSSDFLFEHNLITHLPSAATGNFDKSQAGIFLDGSLDPPTTSSDILIQHNVFGDDSSCTAAFSSSKDTGGYCAGILTYTGLNKNIVIKYNNFIHLEEGIHFNQLTEFQVGKVNSLCTSCTIEYNYVVNYHRIGIEIQVSTTNTISVSHNAVIDPLGSYYGTFAVSLACCTQGRVMGTPGFSPAIVFDDNVLIASIAGYSCPPYGVEFWGRGARGTGSLIEGLFCNGYTWGWGETPWAIKDNYICGPNYAKGGGYISNQQHQRNEPALSGNSIESRCDVRASAAPSISPAGGKFAGRQIVTITTPRPNTGIWFTTDGTIPIPGQGTAKYYTGPITIQRTTKVNAVGMWGSPNQPVGYPAGYGYTASTIVSALFQEDSERNTQHPRTHAGPH